MLIGAGIALAYLAGAVLFDRKLADLMFGARDSATRERIIADILWLPLVVVGRFVFLVNFIVRRINGSSGGNQDGDA